MNISTPCHSGETTPSCVLPSVFQVPGGMALQWPATVTFSPAHSALAGFPLLFPILIPQPVMLGVTSQAHHSHSSPCLSLFLEESYKDRNENDDSASDALTEHLRPGTGFSQEDKEINLMVINDIDIPCG